MIHDFFPLVSLLNCLFYIFLNNDHDQVDGEKRDVLHVQNPIFSQISCWWRFCRSTQSSDLWVHLPGMPASQTSTEGCLYSARLLACQTRSLRDDNRHGCLTFVHQPAGLLSTHVTNTLPECLTKLFQSEKRSKYLFYTLISVSSVRVNSLLTSTLHLSSYWCVFTLSLILSTFWKR